MTSRVLLKLSGEAFVGDPDSLSWVAPLFKDLMDHGVEIVVVVGGGNILRGKDLLTSGLQRSYVDLAGMLATCVNGLVLKHALQSKGLSALVMAARHIEGMPLYNAQKAEDAIKSLKIPICVGGTGNPYFSTDTAGALRAAELGATILVKVTKVDGVYDRDPKKDIAAVKYDKLSYEEAMGLNIMDATAVALCRDNRIKVRVVSLFEKRSIIDAIIHDKGGTTIF